MPNVCNFRKFSYFRVFYYIIFFLMYLEQILLLLRPVLQLCRHEELASLVFGMDHSLDLHQDCEIYDLFGE
uniref:Uncharacterized protein n=1 Tax=Populus trichocarpa TaxID=3694 RepID=A0A2K1Y156_POPTR